MGLWIMLAVWGLATVAMLGTLLAWYNESRAVLDDLLAPEQPAGLEGRRSRVRRWQRRMWVALGVWECSTAFIVGNAVGSGVSWPLVAVGLWFFLLAWEPWAKALDA